MGRYLLDPELIVMGFKPCHARVLGADGRPVLTKFGGHGKWSRPDVPHDGWWNYVKEDHHGRPLTNPFEFVPPHALELPLVATDDDDDPPLAMDYVDTSESPTLRADGSPYELHGHPSPICEMCEKQPITIIHRLWHPDCPLILDVGHTCAVHMVFNNKKAIARERAQHAVEESVQRFSDQAEWRGDSRKQSTIVGMFYLHVEWDGSSGYRAHYWHKPSGYGRTSSKSFPLVEAKAAAIHAAARARHSKPWRRAL